MLDEPPPVPDLSLLLVTIDSLRADIVERDTGGLPRIRDLAARSVRYRRAYAQGTRTAMALGTLMTGRYSARVDWELWQYRRGRLFPLSEALLSGRAAGRRVFTTLPRVAPGAMLAERLRRAGLRTLAAVHGGTDEFMKPDLAFARGFDAFVDPAPGERRVPSSNLVADTAVSQLEKAGDDKIFQWVHILDPHEADGSRSEYEKLVAEADRALGRILDALERTGRADRTAVVVTADHGESFGEHRRGRHGTSLYDEQTRIPLLVRMPGATPRDEMRPVAAIDIAATLLVLGGADTSGIDGVNLVPSLVRGAMPEHRPVFIELHRYVSRRARPTHDMKGVIAAPLKLIVDRKRWTAELFDIVADPAETRNLIRRRPDDFRRLEALLDAFICDAERSHPLP